MIMAEDESVKVAVRVRPFVSFYVMPFVWQFFVSFITFVVFHCENWSL